MGNAKLERKNKLENTSKTKKVAQPTSQVKHIVRAEDILIKKWHSGNKKYHTTSLKKLWMNGFHCGQGFMDSELNKSHLKKNPKYLSKEGFYVTELFIEEILDAFWFSLENAQISILEQKP